MEGKKPQNYEGIVRVVLWALMLSCIYFVVRGGVRMASSGRVETTPERFCVVIDAGHGSGNLRKVAKGK